VCVFVCAMRASILLLLISAAVASAVVARHLRAAPSRLRAAPLASGSAPSTPSAASLGMQQVLFVECGFGCDQHGQNATKAVVRACRSAIEFNSIPSIGKIVPGGYDNMKLHLQIGVPGPASQIDLTAVAAIFPYGQILSIQIDHGGLLAHSGIALPAMGDTNDDMIIAVACVTVGY
jgi:uncharacterized protein (TIGR02058 family)